MTNKFRIDDDGEDADVLVCALATEPLMHQDNLVGQCARCRRMIQFRPHAPKLPEKLCVECAMPGLESEADRDSLRITRETAAEIVAFMHRKRNN